MMELRKSGKKMRSQWNVRVFFFQCTHEIGTIQFSPYMNFFYLFCMHEERPSSFGVVHAILTTVPIGSVYVSISYVPLLSYFVAYFHWKKKWNELNMKLCVIACVSKYLVLVSLFFRVILFPLHMFWSELRSLLFSVYAKYTRFHKSECIQNIWNKHRFFSFMSENIANNSKQ